MSLLTRFILPGMYGLLLLSVVGCAVDVSQSQSQPIATDTPAAITNEPTATTEPQPEADSKADANVLFVQASLSGSGLWRFNVTVEHPDTGWQCWSAPDHRPDNPPKPAFPRHRWRAC